ncbi:MAG TPA: dihydrodipicolinate synthase family protein [Terriglobia bacterium]|nr:dihydrodipicolinate synthase family protein [Terriglobia bacterium]
MTTKLILDRLHGIVPPLVTPFNRRGGIDEGAFCSNLKRYTGIGLAGVMVAGTSGEAPFLTVRERLRLTELARELMRPDELVLAGTGLESTRETIALSREAAARGADVALVVTPGYYKSKMDGPALTAHYRAVADAVPRPILLYSIPQCTGVSVPAEAVAALSRHPNMAGLKESSGDLAYLRRILRLVRPRFRVFCGSMAILLDVLRSGAAGGIVGQADFAPELCVAFYEAFRQGRQKLARELHAKLVPLAAEINLKYGTPALKVAMDLAGYRGGEPRSPLLPVSLQARRSIARALKAARLSLAF